MHTCINPTQLLPRTRLAVCMDNLLLIFINLITRRRLHNATTYFLFLQSLLLSHIVYVLSTNEFMFSSALVSWFVCLFVFSSITQNCLIDFRKIRQKGGIIMGHRRSH